MLVVTSCSPDSSDNMPFIRRKRNHSASVRNNQIEAQGFAWLCFAHDHSWFQGNIMTDDESNYSLYGKKISGGGGSSASNSVKEDSSSEESSSSSCVRQSGEEEDIDEEEDSELEEKLQQLIIRTNASVANASRRGHHGSSSCSTSSSCEELETIEEELNNNDLSMMGSSVPKSCSSPTSSTASSTSLPSKEYFSVTLTDHFSGLRYQLPKITVNNSRDERGEKNDLFICADGQVSFEIENIFKGQKADMMIQRHIGSPFLLGKKCLVYNGPMTIVFNEIVDAGRSWCL